ncbi:U3 small nucleolar RNA-associated protein 18 homolog isoform X3 [Pezoporus flaviventris]|uniref:U3 small nucleolar RNA-associated protein 18 homolog isoform X3 n=1 Tax=Pezoporus flaviventris TaxID=889875 RepID=UPI002AB0C76B|nr:U3 small nucleolar RNA-associated protein 18 homolog isoform X3 [Pezoporus flaviventris]
MAKTAKTVTRRSDSLAVAAAAAAAERAAARQAAAEAVRRAQHLKELSCASGAERDLEELVFGDSVNVEEDDLLQCLAGPQRLNAPEWETLQKDSSDSEVENEAKGNLLTKKPAWVDEDDEAEENVDMTHRYRRDFMKSDAEKTLTKKKLKRRLEEQFQRAMGGVPAWADLENRKKSKKTASDSESDEDDDLLRRTGNFVTNSESLPRGILKMGICLPANQERFADGRLATVQFHPSAQVVMTAGHDRSVSLFQTKELISTMKVNGRCTASAFTPDSSKVYSYSKEGEVFIWDVRSRKCLHKFEDEGSLEGKCIALSKNNQYVACGSASGVVNLYTTDGCLKEHRPKPVKAIMNLVTSATCVTFNPTTEILAVASRETDEAVKLVHIPSYTVFSNFPVFRRKQIYLAQSMDFSPRSGYFSIANNKGKALLFSCKGRMKSIVGGRVAECWHTLLRLWRLHPWRYSKAI